MSLARTNHAAVEELRRGCEELQKPPALATELVNFLQLRRLHGAAISPGYTVDELWHWMLLNTEVADKVHSLLGGKIHHSTARTCDDIELGFRRAKALSMMHRDGCNPHLQFWQEPGTFLHTIQEYKLQVTGLEGEPLSVFASSLSSQEDVIRLAHEVWAYPPSQLTLLPAHGRGSSSPGPAGAEASNGIKRERTEEVGTGSDEATPAKSVAPKRQRTSRASTTLAPPCRQPSANASLRIVVKDQSGNKVELKISPRTPMSKVYAAYARAKAMEWNPESPSFSFVFDGFRIYKDDTAEELKMENGDMIDEWAVQRGC